FLAVLCAPAAPCLVAGRAPPARASRRRAARVDALPGALPGRARLPRSGPREGRPRLVAVRPAAEHLAAREDRHADHRWTVRPTMGRARHELGGLSLRRDHRLLA